MCVCYACVHTCVCDFAVQKCAFAHVHVLLVCAALPTYLCSNEKTMFLTCEIIWRRLVYQNLKQITLHEYIQYYAHYNMAFTSSLSK